MKISNITNTKINHKGALTSKTALKALEKISEHGTTFVAATTFIMASGVRPLVINATPNVKKENKEYATTNSIASGLIKFAMVEAIALPIENAVKNIDKNPEKYLSKETIKTLQGNAKTLVESSNYKFATQIFKLGTGLITAIPKAMLTVALIPVIMDKLFKKEKTKKSNNPEFEMIYKMQNSVFNNDFDNKTNNTPSFKGGINNIATKGIAKILNNSSYQNFVKKYTNQHTDFARNISVATDILLTASFINQTKKSKLIEEDRKKALISNNIISTGITLLAGCSIDSFIKKNTDKYIKKFTEIHKNNPKLPKYIEGINILRPTIIFASLYYGILPIFSTYLADKTENIELTKNKTI